jgi:hypothetical protein
MPAQPTHLIVPAVICEGRVLALPPFSQARPHLGQHAWQVLPQLLGLDGALQLAVGVTALTRQAAATYAQDTVGSNMSLVGAHK